MPENHSQRAYSHIRSKLLDGSATPGSRLSYGPIGKEIGVSATPVREAVGQLASEGFVELVPQLGAIVRDLTRDEAVELYELREALESYRGGTGRGADQRPLPGGARGKPRRVSQVGGAGAGQRAGRCHAGRGEADSMPSISRST